MFDKDMSGAIDMDEFIKACTSLGHKENNHRTLKSKREKWSNSLHDTEEAARKGRILKSSDAVR